jgi:hypothetical protein
MRDQSRAGHVLGGAQVADLPDEVSVRDVVRTRIRDEVAAYNADPGPVFRGLVQPADALRHSDGFRTPEPRPLPTITRWVHVPGPRAGPAEESVWRRSPWSPRRSILSGAARCRTGG